METVHAILFPNTDRSQRFEAENLIELFGKIETPLLTQFEQNDKEEVRTRFSNLRDLLVNKIHIPRENNSKELMPEELVNIKQQLHAFYEMRDKQRTFTPAVAGGCGAEADEEGCYCISVGRYCLAIVCTPW